MLFFVYCFCLWSYWLIAIVETFLPPLLFVSYPYSCCNCRRHKLSFKRLLRGRIECVVTLIFSQRDWMGSHEAVEAIKLITFDLYLSSLCPCGSVGCVEWADCMGDPQLSALRLSIPFLNKHTHQMLACQHKGTHGCLHTNTCTQTGKFDSRRQTDLHVALSVFWFEL